MEQLIISEYKSGATLESLARKYQRTRKTVKRILESNGVQIRPRGRALVKLFSPEDKQKMLEMWNDSLDQRTIAKEFNTTPPKVRAVLIEFGYDSYRTRAGHRNKRWVETRRQGPDGYVKIKVHPEDPLYCMATDKDYCLEHRYVMAKYLGRPLTSSEYVHHLDGDRANNNIENLQLLSSRHPKGQKWQCQECGSHNIKSVEL